MINSQKIHKALVKSLLFSNFMLLKGVKGSKVDIISKSLKLKKTKFFALNLLETLKSLKQFLRLIQFSKKHSANHLYIWADNLYTNDFFTNFFNLYPLSTGVTINNWILKQVKTFSLFKVLLSLGEPAADTKNLFKILQNRKFFLIQKINTNLNTNNWGYYKIYNELSDYKKMLLIGILLTQTFKK